MNNRADIFDMTSIQIDKNVRDRLKESIKGGAIDDKLNILMDKSEIPPVKYTSKRGARTNIRISSDTIKRLKQYKIYGTESHSDTILRLLNEYSDE